MIVWREKHLERATVKIKELDYPVSQIAVEKKATNNGFWGNDL